MSEGEEVTPPPSQKKQAGELAKEAERQQLAKEHSRRAIEMSKLAADPKFMLGLEKLKTAFEGMRLEKFASAEIPDPVANKSEQLV